MDKYSFCIGVKTANASIITNAGICINEQIFYFKPSLIRLQGTCHNIALMKDSLTMCAPCESFSGAACIDKHSICRSANLWPLAYAFLT